MRNISAPFVLRELNTVGFKEAPKGPVHTFAQWTFLYLISGEVLTYTAGETILCGSHDILIVPPGTEFSVRWYKDSIGYTGGFEEAALKDRSLPLLRIKAPKKVKITYSEEIFADELMAALFRNLGVQEIAASIVDLLLRLLKPTEDSSSRLCMVFLDEVFSGAPVTGGPGYYASLQGISEADLNRAVKEETGRTAGDWIGVARMSLAKLYLRDASLSIAEVCERVGLEDQSYFARFFRKSEGVTPSAFRKGLSKKS